MSVSVCYCALPSGTVTVMGFSSIFKNIKEEIFYEKKH